MYRSERFGILYQNGAKTLADAWDWRVGEESRMASRFSSKQLGAIYLEGERLGEKKKIIHSFIHSIGILDIYCELLF